MAYVDGFVAAVPTANKEKFRQHGETIDQLFIKHGALQVIEAWGEDVPTGKTTDFFKACLLYTSPSPRDATLSRMPSSA